MLKSFCKYQQDGGHIETGKKMSEMQIFEYYYIRQQGNIHPLQIFQSQHERL